MTLQIPIPKKMRALARDRRGYPIPFIILRDKDGRPHFTINDSDRQRRCVLEKRCPVCGTKLDSVVWFVGGPQSAFHEHGAYMDSALHHECMTYALQVCPYLAAPNYSGRIDTGTIDAAKVPDNVTMFLDTMQIPERPVVFVAVASNKQLVSPGEIPGVVYVRPQRPCIAVEYWKQGTKLTVCEAKELLGDIAQYVR